MLYLIFALLGLGIEVVVTAITSKNKKLLIGFSSLWYAPFYAFIPLYFELAGPIVFSFPWFVRGIIYALVCHIIEFAFMAILHVLLGESPSEKDYKKSRWNIKGFTGLNSTPFYFIGGLLIEWIYRSLS